MSDDEKELPDNYSPVRFIVSESHDLEYKPLNSFEEAKDSKNSVCIMEGDWGGQIYLVCPMNLVKCTEQTLISLLHDLDKIAWECNDGEGKGIYYEVRHPGEPIIGGMGGGTASQELWVHEEFSEIKPIIREVIEGKRKKIK